MTAAGWLAAWLRQRWCEKDFDEPVVKLAQIRLTKFFGLNVGYGDED